MCGIAGYLRLRPEDSAPISPPAAREMLAAIRRRGPDGEGQWRSADDLCWLGHRRLAIIDLHTGDQPMCNEDGTIWTVFNGEIYNYAACVPNSKRRVIASRPAAIPRSWCTATSRWGVRGLAERLQGIFAFAVYDTVERTLSLAVTRWGSSRSTGGATAMRCCLRAR